MSPRTNCCTAKLSWDFFIIAKRKMLYWIYFRNTARLLKLRYRRRERSALFCLIKFRIMHVIWKLGEWKMPLFRVLGLSGSGVQFSPVQSAWCAFACCCVLHLFHAFIFSGCCSCLLFILILQLNQKAFHRLAVAFRWNAFRLFNTRIKYLYLNFNAAIIYNLLRTHDCRIWVCCFGNRLFFKPSW